MTETKGIISGTLDAVKALLGKEAYEYANMHFRPLRLIFDLHYTRIREIRETKEDLVLIGKQLKAKLESLERENAFLKALLRKILGLPAESSIEDLEKRAEIFGRFLEFEMDRLSEEYEQYRKIKRGKNNDQYGS